jgi:GNAT superfamily N-acetyltransferase
MMKLNKSQIDFSASLIGMIDSKEKSIFLETVNTKNQIEATIFYDGDVTGVYYSCLYFNELRVHISFNSDTDKFNEIIATFIHSSMSKCNMSSCIIWTAKEYRKNRNFLKGRFNIQPDSIGDYYAPNANGYYYEAVEFIMNRRVFNNKVKHSDLIIRSFEAQFHEKYLSLLNEVMVFDGLPPTFQGSKKNFLYPFEERIKNNSFETFWKGNELIGLYIRENVEIDIIAVARNQQGKGYGSDILTRAIKMIFKNAANDYARLYVLGWDLKRLNFFQKYGMEQSGHFYRLHLHL